MNNIIYLIQAMADIAGTNGLCADTLKVNHFTYQIILDQMREFSSVPNDRLNPEMVYGIKIEILKEYDKKLKLEFE